MSRRIGGLAALLAAALGLSLPTGAGAQVQSVFDVVTREGASPQIFIMPSEPDQDIVCEFAAGSGFTATPGEDIDAGPWEFPAATRDADLGRNGPGSPRLYLRARVNVVDDNVVEAEETHRIDCSGTPISVTISDNDEANISIPASISVDEDVTGGTVEVPVTMSKPVDRRITVTWMTATPPGATGAATPGADYFTSSGTVVFEEGETTATIVVQILNDNDVELTDEIFEVVLGGTVAGAPRSNAVRVTRGRTAVSIVSDDTFSATLTLTPDTVETGEVDLSMSPADPGRVHTFTATLAGPSFAGSIVFVADVVPGSATPGHDFEFLALNAPLRFDDSQRTQTFAVRILNDNTVECSKTFGVTLSHFTTAGVTPLPDGVTVVPATVTIADDAGATDCEPVFSLEIADAAASEADGNVVFTVTRSGGSPTGSVVVNYATASGTATEGVDFTARSGSVAIGGTDTPVTISVPVTDDDLPEGSETFTVTLTRQSAGQRVTLARATATGTIRDDDGISVSVGDASAREGAPVVFTVELSGNPAENVVVNYRVSDGTATTSEDLSTDSDTLIGTLTFAPGAALTQTISIATVDDDIEEGNETFTVTLSGSDAFPVGVSLGTAEATGTIRDNDGVVAVMDRVNEAVLPHVAQAVLANTVSAIAGRIGTADSGTGPAGKANLLQALKAGEHGLESGTTDLEQVLGGASFATVLNAAGDGAAPRVGDVAVWGSGDYRNLSGPDGAVAWDGDMFSLHLGTDVRVERDLLAGVAVARSSGSFDYVDSTDPEATAGNYDSSMIAVHPYASWSADGGRSLWATAGYGRGEIEISGTGGGVSRDTEMMSAAAGGSLGLLADDRLIDGGTATLRLKGEAALARIEVDGSSLVQSAEFDVRRLRAALEGGYECLSGGDSGGCLAPSVEVGMRHDGGDARTGAGVEIGGGLRYTDRASGLTVEGRGRALVLDDDSYEDWGVGGLVRLEPGTDGSGLSFSLAPGFGGAARAADRVYERGAVGIADGGSVPSGHLETEIGYGFIGTGVVTPYAGLSLADEGSRNWRAGVRYRAGATFGVSLEGTRRESAVAADPDHGVTARGRLSW